MKYIFATIFSLTIALVSLPVKSDTDTKGCLHEGNLLKPFDSVWVLDPVLIKELQESYRADGLSEGQIEARLRNADWTGFRLVCHPIIEYKPVSSAKYPAESFSIVGYALTFNRYSMDYYRSIQGHLDSQRVVVND